MAFRLSRRPGSEGKRSTAQHAEDYRAAGARAQIEEKREKQNTCLYVCSIYPPFPIIVSIWETARKIMKQSFVNINSFTSQKKIVIFCFCFTKLEKKNKQAAKVFKSLVICNYASKKATTNHTNTVKQNEQNTKTSIFCFCLTALTCFFVGAWEKNSCNSSSSSATFMGFSFSCHWKKGCQRKAVAGFFHGLVSFPLRNFSAFTHDVYSQKPFVPKRKKKNIKKRNRIVLFYASVSPLIRRKTKQNANQWKEIEQNKYCKTTLL